MATKYVTWNEALHGIAIRREAPPALALALTSKHASPHFHETPQDVQRDDSKRAMLCESTRYVISALSLADELW